MPSGRIFFVGLVPILLLTLFSSTAAGSQQPWTELDVSHGSGAGLVSCVERAKLERPDSWTCLGGELTAARRGPDGIERVSSTVVLDDYQTTPALPRAAGAEDPTTLADDYDSWCESGSVCGRQISPYIAEVKGNGAYGDSRGVIGAFDFIVRQSFNGPYPAWRALLIWDYGPTIVPNTFYTNCRVNVTGPDGFCGENPMYFGNVSQAQRRNWWPSSTGYDQNGTRLSGNTNYHDDSYGSFHAAGYGQTFHASTIHTGRWNSCSRNCKYYQVPWRP